MKKSFLLALLACASFALASTVASAQTWSDLQTSTDEDALIQAIEKPGDEPEDYHTKNVACKRLSIYGSVKAIPALVAMLSNEKQNFNARFALEAMPFDEVDAALAAAAKELKGKCLVGVIDTIGVRGKAESVALLKELNASNTDPAVQKAIYAAAGMIATEEADAFLAEESKKDLASFDFVAARGLGDAVLDAAGKAELKGQAEAAAALYAVAADSAFPKFVKEAGLYRGLLCGKAASAAKVAEIVACDDASRADVALKTIREFDETAGPEVVKALLAAFDGYNEDVQVKVIRALGDRKDETSRKLIEEKLTSLAKNGSVAIKIAVAKAFRKCAVQQAAAFQTFAEDLKNFDDSDLSDAIVAMGVDFNNADFVALSEDFVKNSFLKTIDSSDSAALAYLKIIELRRTLSAGDALVKIAETKDGAVRDGALAALSEIVSLDNFGLLVAALNGETDDAKVDWILRAACTRMPREECAAKVADLFEKADVDSKNKMLPLLKQIGGGTALAAVANACNGATVDKATQILGEWNTPEDATALADICLAIAKQANNAKYHSRGIRGYIRVARQFELPVDVKIAMCKTAFETAKRAEDKALIFEVFKRNIVAENVGAALEYAAYPEFKDAACEAAVFVAEKIRVSQPDWDWNAQTDDAAKANAAKILVDSMKKVVETTGNADLKARAQKLL